MIKEKPDTSSLFFDIDENLFLRELEENKSDAERLFSIFSFPGVAKYLPDSMIPKDYNDASGTLSYFKRMLESGNGMYLAIARKTDNVLIGTVGICNIDHYNKRAEVAYELDPEYWNQGIMTKALKKMIDYAFLKLPIERIQANTVVDNYPSIRLLEKCGFIIEGILGSYRFFKGKNVDIVMLGYPKKKYLTDIKMNSKGGNRSRVSSSYQNTKSLASDDRNHQLFIF